MNERSAFAAAGVAKHRVMKAGIAASANVAAREHDVLPGPARARSRWAVWVEALGVVLSPLLAALVLRLRLMAPTNLPDPAMHTAFIVAPRDMFTRFTAAYASTGRMYEGGRPGFLVPARLDYLAFGAVPGFLVTRYMFALVAVVPVYLLLRRLYGPPAGVAGIVVVLSSPVIVTAWNSDHPAGAVISYVGGGMACLAMPGAPQWRRAWLAAAGILFVMAVWAHGSAVPIVGATLIGYLGVRLARDRAGLLADVALLAGVAVAVTGLLMVASAVVLGHADFIGLTWQAVRYLSTPGQIKTWHSANPAWAPYVAYLLVLPAVLGAFAVAITRRQQQVPTPVLIVGIAAATQLVVCAGLQFFGTLQTLENYDFSCALWAGASLTLAITIAELTRPLADRKLARWLPAAVLLAVPLGYEVGPLVAPFGWLPFGVILVGAVIVAAAAVRGCARIQRPLAAATTAGLSLVVLTAALLVLTVAPIPLHPKLPHTIVGDKRPNYALALGGSSAINFDNYRVLTALPSFVGNATYPGEQLLLWRPNDTGVIFAGIYHGDFNSLSSKPQLTPFDRSYLNLRRPGELLIYGNYATPFRAALRELHHYRPTLIRAGVLHAGPVYLHVWLLRLGLYARAPG